MTKVEQIYHRHESLVNYYANKIWNENNIAMEKEDLKQELRIKLFLAIKSYAKRWKQYRETNSNKPVPIEFFLKTVMANKVKDFIKLINRMPTDSIDDLNFDYGREDMTEIAYDSTDIKIGEKSLISLFEGQERQIMSLLFLKDFDQRKVKKIYKKIEKSEVENIMENGLNKLRDYLESNCNPVQEFRIMYSENLQS